MSIGPKEALFAEFASIARALGHPHRLQLLEQLGQGEHGVEALAERTGLSVANASQHLQQLKRAGLITSRRQGKFVLYRHADEQVPLLMRALFEVGERNLAQVDQIVRSYFRSLDSFEPVEREELLSRARAGEITVIDVRPPDEYEKGHIPGALNIPLDELERRLDEIDPAQEVIAYCRGAYCVLSFEAVASLRARGFRARRLQDGVPEWKAAGLPLAFS